MCTDFGLRITDPNTVDELWAMSGRNMDWLGNTQAARINPFRMNTSFAGTAPDGTDGLKWTSTINAAPISAFEVKDTVDGMNVAGLTFAANMLDCTVYPSTPTSDKYSQSLGVSELGLLILTQLESVDQVIEFFRTRIDTFIEFRKVNDQPTFTSFEQADQDKIYLYQDDVLKKFWKTPGLHMSFRDKEGKAFIVEFLEGKAVGFTYENTYVWTMTNDPTLLEQLKNFSKVNFLNNGVQPSVIIYGQTIPPLPGASNLSGLSADPSPEARFVRVTKKIQFLVGDLQPRNSDEALTACMNIADSAKVSKEDAFVCRVGNKNVYDQTIYQIFRDSINMILFYRTDVDAALKKATLIDLFSMEGNLDSIFLHDSRTQTVIDVTAKMREERIQRKVLFPA